MDKNLIIQKQDEIIAVMQRHLDFSSIGDLRDVNLIESLESELSSLKSAKEEVKSAEILSADEMLTNHFLDDNWEPNYQNIVKIMDKFHSQFQSVQSKENMANKEGLLPCPFCGNYPEWVNKTNPDGHYYLRCHTCQFTISDDRRDKIFGQWNQRIIQPVQSVKGEGERTDYEDCITDIKSTIRLAYETDINEGWSEKFLNENIEGAYSDIMDCVKKMESYKHSESKEQYPDTEADGYVFCGKCGKMK